jgi:hypothetical protein
MTPSVYVIPGDGAAQRPLALRSGEVLGAPLVRYCASSRHYIVALDGETFAIRINNQVPMLDEATPEQLRSFLGRYRAFGVTLLPNGCGC